MEIILKKPESYNLFSVSQANKNPYFNMVEQDKNGYYGLCKTGDFLTRQSAPKVYELNASFYIYSKTFFDLNCKKAITERSIIFEVPHECFDLDHPIDFEFIEFLISNNKLNISLE